MSEQTDQLAKALAGLQAHCGGVKKTGRNLPSEALSVYDSMLRVDQAEAERFGRWACGPGKAGGPEVLAKGVEQASEVLADLCGHKHWEATGDVTACARCGFVRPDDEEPESMADALGVAEEEVPF